MNELENAIELLILATRNLLDGYLHNGTAATKEPAELVYRLAFDAANVADITDALYVKDFIRRIERVAEDVETRQPHMMLVDAGQWSADAIEELRSLMRQGAVKHRTAPFQTIDAAKEQAESIKAKAIMASASRPAEPPTAHPAPEPEWTEPLKKEHVAELHGFTTRTLSTWLKDGKIDHKPVNSRHLCLRPAYYQMLLNRKEPEVNRKEPEAG